MINPKLFRQALLRWYSRHGRDLPWRRTRSPYEILVSEVMLQQTQVATVLGYYNRWLRRFPNFKALARATENDVLHAWQGLGYYRRARNLRETAKIIQRQHGGIFPEDLGAIGELPGLGRYSANAIASFAFDQSVPIVEANTSRVLARLFNLRMPIDQGPGRTALWNYAAMLVPTRGAAAYNSALMDLGALVCLPKPKCPICPVREFCRARQPEGLPIKKPLPRIKQLVENHALVIERNRILLRRSNHRWRGMWILPPLKLDRFKRSSLQDPIYESAFPFTCHRVKLRIFRKSRPARETHMQRWFSFRQLHSIPIPSPHRRAITALLN